MGAKDVEDTLEIARTKAGLDHVSVLHRPRILSDYGPCYLSGDLKDHLMRKDIEHIRGAPNHPLTPGKTERYHRSMKNVIKLRNYEFPLEL
jgi:transposase InsO family protein